MTRMGHATRSAVALVIAACVAYQRGITQLQLPNASLAAFVAILCSQQTLGATLEYGFDALVGAAFAALVHTPTIALPNAMRQHSAFAGALLLLQLAALTAPDLGFGVRMMATATSASLTIGPLIDANALAPTSGLAALGVIAIGVGAAACAAALPPRRSAHAALADQGARANGMAADAFALLVAAFSDSADGRAHTSLLSPASLLQQLEPVAQEAVLLRRAAAWEPSCAPFARHSAAQAAVADGVGAASQLRQLQHMLRALRAQERATAEGALASREQHGVTARHTLHVTFARHLGPPLRSLAGLAERHARASERAVAAASAGGCARGGGGREAEPDTEPEVAALCCDLLEAWSTAQNDCLYPPGDDGSRAPAAVSRFQRLLPLAASKKEGEAEDDPFLAQEMNVHAYAGDYSCVVNSFLLSAMLYAVTTLCVSASPSPALSASPSPLVELQGVGGGSRSGSRGVSAVGAAVAAAATAVTQGGAPVSAACASVRALGARLRAKKSWSGRRAAQYTIAVGSAALVVLLPQGRELFGGAAILAPIEACLQLGERVGGSLQGGLSRTIGAMIGSAAGLLLVTATAKLRGGGPEGDGGGLRSLAVLAGLAAWAFCTCLLRSSRSHGGVAIVAAWNAPFVAAAADLYGAPRDDALNRGVLAMIAAACVVGTSALVAPRWAATRLPAEVAVAVRCCALLLHEEVSVWRGLLGFEADKEGEGRERGEAQAGSKRSAIGSPATVGGKAWRHSMRVSRAAQRRLPAVGGEVAAHERRTVAGSGSGALPYAASLSNVSGEAGVHAAGSTGSGVAGAEGGSATSSEEEEGEGEEDGKVVLLDELPLIVVDVDVEAERSRRVTLRLAEARAAWAQAADLHAEADADAALCGGVGALFGPVGSRGVLLCLRLEQLLDSVAAASGPVHELLGLKMHAWAWASFDRHIRRLEADAQDVCAALELALRLAALVVGGDGCCAPRLPREEAAAAVSDAAAALEAASGALRASSATLSQLYGRAIRGSIADGWHNVGMRAGVADALLNNSAYEAVLGAADDLLELGAEVEAACARAAVRAGVRTFGLAPNASSPPPERGARAMLTTSTRRKGRAAPATTLPVVDVVGAAV